MDRLRIAVAGCGMAGLAAATLLSRRGHEITLFERFEEARPIGSGLMLQPTGMAVLDRLGLFHEACRRGAPIDGLLGYNQHGAVALKADYAQLHGSSVLGLGIHRSDLFDILFTAALESGVVLRTGFDVAETRIERERRSIIAVDGEACSGFDLVVDASGLRSPLVDTGFRYLKFGALWGNVELPSNAGFNLRLLEQRYHDASQMVGLLPTFIPEAEVPARAAFFWSLRGCDFERWRAAPLEDWKKGVIRLWPQAAPLLEQFATHEDLTFARYAHRTHRRPVGDRLIHLGDAWHSASPQLGQGANMALLDAWSLSEGLRQSRTISDGLRLAVAMRSDHVALYQAITAFFTPLFQSDAQLPHIVRDWITAPLSRFWPVRQIQSALVAGLFGTPLSQLGLTRPDYSALAKPAAIASRAAALDQSYSPTTRHTSRPEAS